MKSSATARLKRDPIDYSDRCDETLTGPPAAGSGKQKRIIRRPAAA
jgi:hypothetical protein